MVPVSNSDDMKKIILYFALIVVASWTLTGCEGRNWDTDDALMVITANWSNDYVSKVIDHFWQNDTVFEEGDGSVSMSFSKKDTLKLDMRWLSGKEKGDSVNVHSSLVEISDSVAVVVDGYRYSDDFWAHMYTIDPGIINYEGKFHIDFYETGKTTPWAWGEVTYQKSNDGSMVYNYKSSKPKVGRY